MSVSRIVGSFGRGPGSLAGPLQVLVSDEKLIGEIIEVKGDLASIQVSGGS